MRLNDDKRYEEIKQEVADIYKKLHITSFPIKVTDVCKGLGIKVRSYDSFTPEIQKNLSFCGDDGAVAFKDTERIILYNRFKAHERIRSTILHECAHIVLLHLIDDEENESESEFFACYMLAPPVLIKFFNLFTIQELQNQFGISRSLAINAYDRYRSWCKYKHFHPDYTDYELTILNLAKEGTKMTSTPF